MGDAPKSDPGEALPRLLPPSTLPGSGARFVPIGVKLGLAVVLVVLVATALVFFHSTRRERDALVDAKRKAADMVADLSAASLSAPLDFGDEDAVRAELEHLRQNRDITGAAVWLAGKPQPLAKIGKLSKHGEANRGTRVFPDLVQVSRAVTGGERKLLGTTVIEFSLARENDAYVASRNRILWLCLALAIGTMGVLLVVSRRQVVKPIDALLKAVRRLERGERGIRVNVEHNDEIGRLARAFEAMDSAIFDRETRLAEAHNSLRELFDHMRQAIMVFDRDGRVVGAQSRQAGIVFDREDLKGASVRDLLYPDAGPWDAELQAFETWMALAFDVTIADWPEVNKLAPQTVRLHSGYAERILALEFRPIVSDGQILRAMLLCTDETEKFRLEREVAVQGERHARQMAAMRRLVSGGGQQFVTFLEGARSRLSRTVAIFGGRKTLPLVELAEGFGHLHTLRGEARIFGLDELASALTTLESDLAELRGRAQAQGSAQVTLSNDHIETGLAEARELVDEAERLFVEASPIGRAVLEQVTVRRQDLTRLCEVAVRQGGELAGLAERLSAKSLGDVAAPFSEQGPRWAESLNKRARVEVEGREVLVSARLARVLGGALTHLVKNAVAHGIETPEERQRAGKMAVGLIRIGATASADNLSPTIYVEDDGRGFADNPLLSAAAARGRPLAAGDSRESSFRSAAPTDDAEMAGRGVGLFAVVRDLSAEGFALSIEASADGGTRFSVGPTATLGARATLGVVS
jgi:two-component system, chemotaxis family, sensor kinase CheA